MSEPMIEWVAKHADRFSVPRSLAFAVIQVESAGEVNAIRYEAGYKWLWDVNLRRGVFRSPASPLPGQSQATEEMGQKISWGPMQVMGATARELGFKGWFPELCGEEGVRYGCMYLSRQHRRFNDWKDAVAAYNLGSVRISGGRYENYSYVMKVERAGGFA